MSSRKPIRIGSCGCGQQSVAGIITAKRGLIDLQAFVFAHVGPESENPKTLQYVEEVLRPYMEKHSILFIELWHAGGTLYQKITGDKNRGYMIPAFFISTRGKKPGTPVRARRQCTAEQKVEVVDYYLRSIGAEEVGAECAIFFSSDEVDRVKPNTNRKTREWKEITWPLLWEVPQPMSRQDCINLIEDEGLPVPPSSACEYCPHHPVTYWQQLRTTDLATFNRLADLEEFLRQRQIARGQPPIFFTRICKPLREITTEDFAQAELFQIEDGCSEGTCMT